MITRSRPVASPRLACQSNRPQHHLCPEHNGQPARRPPHQPCYCRRVVVACVIHMKIKKGICGDHLIIYHSVIDKQFMSARSQHVAPMFISPIEKKQTFMVARSLPHSHTLFLHNIRPNMLVGLPTWPLVWTSPGGRERGKGRGGCRWV